MLTSVSIALIGLSPGLFSAGEAPPIPRLVSEDGQYRFLVDDKPFLMLGGQAHNSTTSNAGDLQRYFEALVWMNGNTAEVPIYWDLIEPEPGQYDFELVDRTIEMARASDVRLIFLWFASWKNGESHYAPEWVKRDTETYPRVIDAWGKTTDILSPLAEASRDGDARAFRAVMSHIKGIDEAYRTVIMMQVENEPGFLHTDRDYSQTAQELFDGPVPGELLDYLRGRRESLSETMASILAGSGYPESGTWEGVFGRFAEEAFTAWHIARYIDVVTAAGKEAYPLPMYVNAWLVEPGGERPGKWPSGGPTEHVMDIWKYAAPHVDLLAPDIYFPKYIYYAKQYTRPDNPLFVPEIHGNPFFAPYPMITLVRFNGLNATVFGMDGVKGTSVGELFRASYGVLRPLLPLIEERRYTDTMYPFIQGISEGEDWAHAIPVGGDVAAVIDYTSEFNPHEGRGWGLIMELAPGDYVVAGVSFRVTFRALEGPPREIQMLAIDRGTFVDGQWRLEKRRNGDERRVELPKSGGIMRVKVLMP